MYPADAEAHLPHVIKDSTSQSRAKFSVSPDDDAKSQSALIAILQDKGKMPAGDAMCRLVGFDCFIESSTGTSRMDHIASR